MTVATRPLGQTGRTVSELGFACAGRWASRRLDDAVAVKLIHRAIRHGITTFAATSHQGDGLGEERLGRALAELGPAQERLMVSTTAGVVRIGRWEWARDFSPDIIEAQIVGSLDRLGLERLPLLFLDGPEPAHLSDDLLDTLAAVKGEEIVGLLGLRGTPRQIAAGLETGLFDVVMPTYSPLHRTCEAVIDRAAAAGLGVMAASPLAGMAFAPPADWHAALRRTARSVLVRGEVRHAGRFRFLTDVKGWTPAQASLGFVLADPGISAAVFATTDPAHLDQNAAASGRILSDAVHRRILSV